MRYYSLQRIQTILQQDFGIFLIKSPPDNPDQNPDSYKIVTRNGKIIYDSVSLDAIRIFLTRYDYET